MLTVKRGLLEGVPASFCLRLIGFRVSIVYGSVFQSNAHEGLLEFE